MTEKIRKMKDEAAGLLLKGKHSKALKLYQQVMKADPDDFTVYNNIGYLQRRLGQRKEAIKVFEELTDLYAQQGFLLKAIATCKVVLEIDPQHKTSQAKLADLYAKQTDKQPRTIKVLSDEDAHTEAAEAGGLAPSAEPIDISAEQAQDFGVVLTTPLDELDTLEDTEAEQAAPAQQSQFGMIDLSPEGETATTPEAAEEEPSGEEPLPEVEALPEVEPLPAEQEPAGEEPPAEVDALPEKPEQEAVQPAVEVEEPVEQEKAEEEPAEGEVLDEVELDMMEFEEPSGKEETVPEIPLFSDLPPDAFVAILERMKVLRVKAGDWIVKEGARGDSMFLVASGVVRVLKQLHERKMLRLAVLGEGAFFGEMSVLKGGPRGASVQAVKTSQLFEISKEILDDLIADYPSVGAVLHKFTTQRLLRNVMTTSALFKPFSSEERVRIIERFVHRDVTEGEELITEGAESEGLFVVLRGKMKVTRQVEDGSEIMAGELNEGEVFGEISCLRKDPAVATVRAATPGAVLRLPRSDFDEVVLSHPQILELVNRLGEKRLAMTMNVLAKKGVLI